MTDNTQIVSFEESVRKRPFMYIGNNGIIDLIRGIILDCINLCKTDKILFSISILGENTFNIGLISDKDISPFIEHFSEDTNLDYNNWLPKVLRVIAEKLEIRNGASSLIKNNTETVLHFEFDKTIIDNTYVDYQKLCESLLQIALLNRNTEILVKDTRQNYLNQNYYHLIQ